MVTNLTVIFHPAGEEEDEEEDEDDIEGGTKRAAEDDDDDEEVGQLNQNFVNLCEQSGDLIISHLFLPLPLQDVETKKQKTDDDD